MGELLNLVGLSAGVVLYTVLLAMVVRVTECEQSAFSVQRADHHRPSHPDRAAESA
jgi:hypothetical protein